MGSLTRQVLKALPTIKRPLWALFYVGSQDRPVLTPENRQLFGNSSAMTGTAMSNRILCDFRSDTLTTPCAGMRAAMNTTVHIEIEMVELG